MTQPAEIRFRKDSALRTRRRVIALAGWLAVLVAATVSNAQQTAAPTTAETETTTDLAATTDAESGDASIVAPPRIREQAGRIQYVGPDTYILLDAEGRPQAVPGMTYEDFLSAWKKSQQTEAPQSTARFVLESIELEGTTRDGFAELDCEVSVRLLVNERVDIPLGLVGAILQGEPRFSTTDQRAPASDESPDDNAGHSRPARNDYLTQNPESGGMVAHVAGRQGERRRLSMKLIVPLSRDGAESTLQLSFPRAVSSNLTLTTQAPVSDASVNFGALVEQKQVPKGGTRLRVAGPIGKFRLTWHSTEPATKEQASVLSATGAIRVSLDGRSVRSVARLKVQSYGGGFDRFRVRLPPGAQLATDVANEADAQRPKYRLTVEERMNGVAAAPDTARVVLVEFRQKQLAPVVIELATEQPIGLKGEESAVELAGFEVLGAVRQFGDVALQVADDWQARWQIGEHVRQVEVDELEGSLQQLNPSAAFQYDRQPWSLGVRVESRQTRIHATPQYDLQCLPDEARLTLRLNYQVYGGRAFEFRIRMNGWSITGSPLESGGLVDLDKILRSADDTLTLPLSQASTPRAEISLSLRRPLPRDQPRFELPLPVPIADSIGTGDLIARATPDIELQADLQNSVGLAPVGLASAAEPQTNSGDELHFRTVLPGALLVAERRSRAQQVSAEVVARIHVAAAEASVDQQFVYDVQHVPVKELLFETPREAWSEDEAIDVVLLVSPEGDEPNASRDETPLSVTPDAAKAENPDSDDVARFRVTLPQPRLGQFTVHARYRVARPDAARGGVWQLPLIQPVGLQQARLAAQVRAPRGVSVSLDGKADSSWKATPPDNAIDAPSPVFQFSADGREIILPLMLTTTDFNPSAATTIDRIWLQAWYSGGMRQDRAAMRFRAAGTQATVELPPQSAGAEMEVLLDGKPAQVLTRDEGRIVVRLPPSARQEEANEEPMAEHTLELRSRQPVRRALLTRHQLTPPFLAGGTSLSQVYWQIILPGDEHIVRSPARMSSASRWQWFGSFWGHRPAMSQAELEKWAGASAQLAPGASQNEYLYTGLAPVSSIELITAPRWLVVLTVSSAALVIGLVWVYLPAARRGWIAAAAACLIAGLAIAFPVSALLLGQAAALGVVAALLGMALKRATARPTHWPVTVSGGSSQRQVAPRSDSILMPPVAATASTAPTVPLRISDSQQ